MFSIITRLLTRHSTFIVLPISALLGFIGYKIENLVSDKYTPSLKSVQEKRVERLLKEEDKEVDSIKEHKFVPKTIFEKNLSPSLKELAPKPKRYSDDN